MSKWPLQKLRNFEDTQRDKNKMKHNRTSMLKYDGRQNSIWVNADGSVQYFTSSGLEYDLLDDQIFPELPVGVYFAEMMGEGKTGVLGDRRFSGIQTNMVSNFKKGLFNKHKPVWRIFDYVTHMDFQMGNCKIPFIERLAFMIDHVPYQYLTEHMECTNHSHTELFMSRAIEAGFEGIVSIDDNHMWNGAGSRKYTAMKWKKLKTADLLVIEELPGEGKYSGMIGSLLLEDGEGKTMCSVGSGLNDEQRASLGSFVGKIVEVRYEQVMDSKLIQPVFLCVRDDKTIPEVIKC